MARASHARKPSAINSASAEQGFSLVELLVAVAIGLILCVAVLTVQVKLSAQNMRAADVGMRDNEVRAAMDQITRDLSGAGFLSGGTHLGCYATLNYNTAVPSPYFFTSYSVASLAAANGMALPFVAAPGLKLNYPKSTSSNRSDVLVIRTALDATQFPPATTPLTPVAVNTGYTPMSSGILPLASNKGFNAGDVGLLQVTMGPLNNPAVPQQRVCVRVPISAVSMAPVNGNDNVGSSGALMPNAYYTDFSTQVGSLGITAATALTGPLINQGKLASLGSPAMAPKPATTQRTYAYFIDTDPTRYQWPTLVRASINPLNDLEIAAERQEIGAGVVSLQVLFGVDPGNTGGVTAYQTGAQAVAAKTLGWVRSVKILVLTRALYPDREFDNSKVYPSMTLPLKTWFNEPGYTDYTIDPTSEINQRFVAQQTEIAVRNELWPG